MSAIKTVNGRVKPFGSQVCCQQSDETDKPHFDANNPDQCVTSNNDKEHCSNAIIKHSGKRFWTHYHQTFPTHSQNALYSWCFPVIPRLNNTKRKQIVFYLLQADRLISVFWTNPESPSISHWLRNLSHCLALEKWTYALRENLMPSIKNGGHSYTCWKGTIRPGQLVCKR